MLTVNPVLAALAPGGTEHPAATICYESIFLRDHAHEFTRTPWWYERSPDMEQRLTRAGEIVETLGLDWYELHVDAPRAYREGHIEERDGAVWLHRSSEAVPERLYPPVPGGECRLHAATLPEQMPETLTEIERLFPIPEQPFDDGAFVAQGHADFPQAFAQRFPNVARVMHISSPLWGIFGRLGFEGAMMLLAQRPDLAEHAARAVLAHTLEHIKALALCGAQVIWIEECLLDQISPVLYRDINVLLLRELTAAIRASGMYSILYYCGNPWTRFDALLDSGADALALEESKKDFVIDIAEVIRRVENRCAVVGNLDAYGILERGTDADIVRETERQWQAAVRAGGRFVMGTGSPVTPDTPIAHVATYARMVHACS